MKIFFDRLSQQFAVAEYNPNTNKTEVVDSDSDLDEILQRYDLLDEEANLSETSESSADLEFDDCNG